MYESFADSHRIFKGLAHYYVPTGNSNLLP